MLGDIVKMQHAVAKILIFQAQIFIMFHIILKSGNWKMINIKAWGLYGQ